MKIRQGKDIILRWKIATNGEALPLEGRNLTLILSTPNGRERVLSYTTEGDTISTRLFGKEITLLGDYTLTLWENRGEQGQTAVDAVNAFELVKYSTMEGGSSSCGNLEAEVLSLSGDLGVFQQGTTTEKNEQVDRNTADIAELQEDVNAINITLDDLEKADASLREEVANVKGKDAEQDEEITSLLDILEGKLDIKDLGSGLRPDQAVSEIIQYVRSNEIKSALVFKYIDTDNSSTFGICISRTGTSGWIIYLVASKGLEVLKFNSRGSRETWNEYGGVLRHDMNSVADEQLECLSIKGIKSVLATKQDALISGQNIKTINGKDILGSGNIKIEAGITEEEKAEINAKIEGKADIADVEELGAEISTKAPKSGYAPDLKVNFAKELVGRGEAKEQVIGGIRPTGVRSIGDGNATITKIKGESVVWNQWCNYNKLAPTAYGLSIEKTNDGIRLYGTSTKTGASQFRITLDTRSRDTSNKYIVYDTLRSTHKLLLNSSDYSVVITMGLVEGESYDIIVSPQIHNLTQMFTAGNEPKTIEEFEARKPLNVSNEYNEGTIVSYNGEALKSVGFNAFNGTYAKVIGGQTYHATGTTSISFAKELDGASTPITLNDKGEFIPEEDGYVFAEGTNIVIHLTHSYTPDHVDEYEEDVHPLPDVKSILDADGNKLFPHGLLSAGSVHDEITATKAIKRIGVVDMGTLDWYYSTNAYPEWPCFYSRLIDKKKMWNNIVCGKYPLTNNKYDRSQDKVITGAEYFYSDNIIIRDSAFTTVATFKQAMSGVLLYYELAEPIEVDLPEPLNMTYEAWDFGTEELIAKGATTPLNAEIVYQFNAVDRIRENSAKNEELVKRIEALEAMITQLTAQTTNEGGASNEQM